MDQETAAKTRRVQTGWNIFTGLYIVVISGIFLVMMLTDASGPVQWICEWQAEHILDGRCSMTLSVLLAILPFLFLLFPAKAMVQKIFNVKLARKGSTKYF